MLARLIVLLFLAGYCSGVEIELDGAKLDTADLSKIWNLLRKLPLVTRCERYWYAVRETYEPQTSYLGEPEPSLFENLAQKVLAQGNKQLANYLNSCAVALGGREQSAEEPQREPVMISIGTGNESSAAPSPTFVGSVEPAVEPGSEPGFADVTVLALLNYEAELEKLRRQLASSLQELRGVRSEQAGDVCGPIVTDLKAELDRTKAKMNLMVKGAQWHSIGTH